MTKKALDTLAKELKEIKRLMKEFETKADSIESTLKDELKKKDVEELITTNGHKLTFKKVSRTSVDTKELKEKEPSIYERYTRTSEYMRFTIN